jgi:hypothetical protein
LRFDREVVSLGALCLVRATHILWGAVWNPLRAHMVPSVCSALLGVAAAVKVHGALRAEPPVVCMMPSELLFVHAPHTRLLAGACVLLLLPVLRAPPTQSISRLLPCLSGHRGALSGERQRPLHYHWACWRCILVRETHVYMHCCQEVVLVQRVGSVPWHAVVA